jgi:hypothetical protein
MAAMTKFMTLSSLILIAIGVSLAAAAVLFTIPANPIIWQVATWTLAAGLVGLLVLCPCLGLRSRQGPSGKDSAAHRNCSLRSGVLSGGCLGLVLDW